jgi:hypothetical protein
MANPILPTDGTHELQERYAQTIVKLLRRRNIIRNLAGRDYEGTPQAGAVKIPVRDTEVGVSNYDIVTGASLATSATTYLQVLVDKNIAVNELIDGYEAAAVPDNLIAQRLDSAAFQLASNAEAAFVAEIVDNGTDETSTTALTDETVYDAISASVGELLKLGIEVETIKIVISTDTETKLLTDVKYTNTASQVGSDRVMAGVISMIRGAEVYRSNKMGAAVEYMVFSTDYAQAGDEWIVPPVVNDLRDGVHIGASALQGRWVYFNKLTRAVGARIKSFA